MAQNSYNFRKSVYNQSFKEFFEEKDIDKFTRRSIKKNNNNSHDQDDYSSINFTSNFQNDLKKEIEDIEKKVELMKKEFLELKSRKIKSRDHKLENKYKCENYESNEKTSMKTNLKVIFQKVNQEDWTMRYDILNHHNSSSSESSELELSNSNHELQSLDELEYESSLSDNENSDRENGEVFTSCHSEINVMPLKDGGISANDISFYMEAEDFFLKQADKKLTSNHTLKRLSKTTNSDNITVCWKNVNNTSHKHNEGIQKLCKNIEDSFEKWMFLFDEGFNILLHGLGSKRHIINSFHQIMVPNESSLVVNGFFPSLTVKEILDTILIDLLGVKAKGSQNECLNLISDKMKNDSNNKIYLLINNLDGGMLRSDNAQEVLSNLASLKNVHLIASIDHINAPLLWDAKKLGRYNFYWCNATTFLPYDVEVSCSNLTTHNNGQLALLSLQSVFKSLTSNAKDIFILLAKYQIKNSSANYSGMTFSELYSQSRQTFLVSSDSALRAQLVEFVDHKLITLKRNAVDGGEYLKIPLENVLLQMFLQEKTENL